MSTFPSEVNAIIAVNRLIGDIFSLLKLLSKLGIDTSHANLDDMDNLACKQYEKGLQDGLGL